MTEPIVGKRYILEGTPDVGKVIFISKKYVVMEYSDGDESLWTICGFREKMKEYVPPPKKVKKTGWNGPRFKAKG